MDQLTEDNIKIAALKFLKAYYKFRNRAGKTEASYDMQTDKGIIADGHLRFQKEDNSYFLATFEASSLDKIEEVQFKLLTNVLFWDSLAAGSLIAAFLFSFGYYNGQFTVNQLGVIGMISSLVVIIVLVALLYFIFCRGFRKYRYIYAAEQFKQYKADDQWIALGENVFPFSDDPYFQELKKQCIYNGFGLMIIDRELDAHLLITPSRNEMFAGKRQELNFSNADGEVANASETKKKSWRALLPKFQLPKFGMGSADLSRYQSSTMLQVILFTISLALISGIFYKEVTDTELRYVNEKQYEEHLKKRAAQAKKEPLDIGKLEGDEVLPFEEIPDSYIDEAFKNKHNIRQFAEEVPETLADAYTGAKGGIAEIFVPKSGKSPVFIASDNEAAAVFDCERIYNFTGRKYIIQAAEYSSFNNARQKMRTLKSDGFAANCLWLGCFSGKKDRYVVFVDLLQNDEAEARSLFRKITTKMKRSKIKTDNLKIRKLSK